jgi:hypothetical protein
MNIILGIDPGLDGGLAILRDGQPPELHVMPTVESKNGRRIVDCPALFAMLLDAGPSLVIVEENLTASMMSSKTFRGGGMANVAKGRWFGQLEGLLTGLEMRWSSVPPKRWQKSHGITGKQGDTKQQAVVIAKRLFPGVNLLRTAKCSKAHDGMADALLIAEWGRRQEVGL